MEQRLSQKWHNVDTREREPQLCFQSSFMAKQSQVISQCRVTKQNGPSPSQFMTPLYLRLLVGNASAFCVFAIDAASFPKVDMVKASDWFLCSKSIRA